MGGPTFSLCFLCGGMPDALEKHWFKAYKRGTPRGKRDGMIRHILERENGNWIENIALFCK